MAIAWAAPALLVGLGGRIVLDMFTRSSEESSLRDCILMGFWQGVGLWYAFKHDLGIPIAFGIAAKVLIEYLLEQDRTRPMVTAMSVIVGAMFFEFLSAGSDGEKERRSNKKHSSQSRRSDYKQSSARHRSSSARARRTVSDITSVDSNSELIGPRASMTPEEREIATLRARASLADSERRRYKEEKKWAIAAGNMALAAQMKWQVKRYSTLMRSFHRQADDLLKKQAAQTRPRLPTIDENKPLTRRVGTVSVDITPSQLKSAVRVNVR